MSAAEERTIVKKLRQFASLVLTVAMAVSLCACGGAKKAETKKLKVGISWSEDNLDTAANPSISSSSRRKKRQRQP